MLVDTVEITKRIIYMFIYYYGLEIIITHANKCMGKPRCQTLNPAYGLCMVACTKRTHYNREIPKFATLEVVAWCSGFILRLFRAVCYLDTFFKEWRKMYVVVVTQGESDSDDESTTNDVTSDQGNISPLISGLSHRLSRKRTSGLLPHPLLSVVKEDRSTIRRYSIATSWRHWWRYPASMFYISACSSDVSVIQ